MDQLDTLRSVKKRYEIDNREYGKDPTANVEDAVSNCKEEADKMFFDVLGRKDKADKTRNALMVLNRFKFLFHLPANIRSHLAKEDYDRVIEEYERAKALYGNSDEQLFQTYLAEAESGVQQMKMTLSSKLREGNLSVEQQKKLIGDLSDDYDDDNLTKLCRFSDPAGRRGGPRLGECADQVQVDL